MTGVFVVYPLMLEKKALVVEITAVNGHHLLRSEIVDPIRFVSIQTLELLLFGVLLPQQELFR